MDKRRSLVDVGALAGMGQASAALLAQLARPPAADRSRLGRREAEADTRDQSTHVALDQAVSEQILSSSLPSGSGLEQAAPIELADTMPASLRRLLLRSDGEPRTGHTPALFKACGCGKTKQHGGPCIFRAWIRESNRARIEHMAGTAARIKAACGAGLAGDVLPNDRFGGRSRATHDAEVFDAPDDAARPSDAKCCVCRNKPAEAGYEPCGHVVLCDECDQPADCPCCREEPDAANDFQFAPGFVPADDEDWLHLSQGRARLTQERFVRSCCLEIWGSKFLGAGNGFMCVQSTAASTQSSR